MTTMNTDFYEALMEKCKKQEASRLLKVDLDEVGQWLQELGYHHYVFGGVEHVYTKEPLTLDEQAAYEKEITDAMDEKVRELTEIIDSRILEDLKNLGWP